MVTTASIAPNTGCVIVFARWRPYVLYLIHGSLAHAGHASRLADGILVGSAVFAGLNRVTNTQTDTSTTLRQDA